MKMTTTRVQIGQKWGLIIDDSFENFLKLNQLMTYEFLALTVNDLLYL